MTERCVSDLRAMMLDFLECPHTREETVDHMVALGEDHSIIDNLFMVLLRESKAVPAPGMPMKWVVPSVAEEMSKAQQQGASE